MSGLLRLLILSFAFSLTACQNAAAPETLVTPLAVVDDRYDMIIRSDVPLWMADGTEDVAPFSFTSEDAFGCVSGVALGDWIQTFAPEGSRFQPDPIWWRTGIGGVIHCSGWFEIGQTRGASDTMLMDAGYTIDLGRDAATNLNLYLWEIGVRTGSTYLVLSRREGDPANQFNVLDPSCAFGVEREAAPNLSIFRTSYCAVPDQASMRATAADAATRPPVGIIRHVGPAPD